MADIADLANDRAEEHLADALRAAVGKSAPETHPDFNGSDCVACDEPIPPKRILLGKVRCIECQSRLERWRKVGSAA